MKGFLHWHAQKFKYKDSRVQSWSVQERCPSCVYWQDRTGNQPSATHSINSERSRNERNESTVQREMDENGPGWVPSQAEDCGHSALSELTFYFDVSWWRT